MDWITAIQTTLEYIDSHLTEEINYIEIAKTINISNMYFHQAFSILVGMTPNEYIRRRRLSLAGEELRTTNVKVIDVAYKYGFESPESFTKAFNRFHGITPRQAKNTNEKLIMFQPLRIEFKMTGGIGQNYRIEQRPSFSLMVYEHRFNVEKVNSYDNQDIPKFWEHSWKSGVFDNLEPLRISDDTYALCSPVSKESEDFNYGIGVLCSDDAVAPKGYVHKKVESGLWAVFPCYGDDGKCMEKMWDYIFSHFLIESEYSIRDYADMETYPAKKCDLFSEIWVPVQKKE